MIKYLVLFACILISACSTQKSSLENHPSHDKSILENLAKEKFEENYFIVPNSTNKYSLVKSKTKTFREIGFDISYFVFDHASNQIIIEDALKSGYVNWEDELNIKAVNRKLDKGNKRKKEVYLFNVATLKRKDL